MKLRALLEQPGGEIEEGREVRFRLRYRGPRDKRPRFREVTALLLPLSEVEQLQAQEAAQKTEGRQLTEGQEYVIQLLGLALRNPDNPAERFCEPRDLQLLRDGLAAPQYKVLLDAYAQLIRNEYPDPVTPEHTKELEEQARDFSIGGQPGPG